MFTHRLFTALLMCLALPAYAFEVERVSLDGQGNQIPGDSRDAAISADGRYLVFTTVSPLVPDDGNGFEDIYLRDLQTGNLTLLTRGINGLPSDRPSRQPAISADGSRIVFASSAANLITGDDGGQSDIFLYDRASGSLVRISRGLNGAEANGRSSSPGISADGKVIVFESLASNLVTDDTNGVQDVFIHGLVSGATRRVSVTSKGGELSAGSSSPSISADGLEVAFASLAPQINPRGDNGLSEIFVHHLVSGETERVRVPPAMMENSDVFRSPVISPDGGWVAFTRTADGGGGLSDILLQTLASGGTIRITRPVNNQPERGFPSIGGVSNDALYVLFDSAAENMIAGDLNGEKDVFLFDRMAGESIRVSGPGPNAGGNDESGALGLTPDGRFALFTSRANNLVAGDTNGAQDIFLNDVPGFVIDSKISGSFYDKTQDGHGFVVEYLGDGRLVFYWFTFTPGGDREWIFGVLEVNGAVAEGEAFRKLGDGARFPPAINPSAIDTESWGTIRFEFTDCDNGTVEWDSTPPYGDGSMDLSRLTIIPALACG